MVEVFWQLLLKLLLILVGVSAITYSLACLFLVRRQKYFIFKPQRVIRATPASFNLDYQDVWLPVAGQTSQVHGWWIPTAAPTAAVWLYLHGNGSNISDEVRRAFLFHQLGFSTLLIDYRGYGRSQGEFPTESSVYEDVEAAWNYLTQVRHIPPERIFLYGHSLGGAIAINLALRYPNLAGLAVEGTFTTMQAMVAHLYQQFLIFPVNLLLHQRFDSLSKVRSLSIPILFIHGTIDPVVPAYMSQALFTAASEPKQLLLVPEAGHHNVEELGRVQYLQAIQWLVEQAQVRQAQLMKY